METVAVSAVVPINADRTDKVGYGLAYSLIVLIVLFAGNVCIRKLGVIFLEDIAKRGGVPQCYQLVGIMEGALTGFNDA